MLSEEYLRQNLVSSLHIFRAHCPLNLWPVFVVLGTMTLFFFLRFAFYFSQKIFWNKFFFFFFLGTGMKRFYLLKKLTI